MSEEQDIVSTFPAFLHIYFVASERRRSDTIFGSDGFFRKIPELSPNHSTTAVLVFFLALDADSEKRLGSTDYLTDLWTEQKILSLLPPEATSWVIPLSHKTSFFSSQPEFTVILHTPGHSSPSSPLSSPFFLNVLQHVQLHGSSALFTMCPRTLLPLRLLPFPSSRNTLPPSELPAALHDCAHAFSYTGVALLVDKRAPNADSLALTLHTLVREHADVFTSAAGVRGGGQVLVLAYTPHRAPREDADQAGTLWGHLPLQGVKTVVLFLVEDGAAPLPTSAADDVVAHLPPPVAAA
eukprot:CAMPEP_0177642514 /NCGR_PEP_ID=MMETSP0447-20121125/7627_1 /TAXON_ID=0 /ORGANISM="Stygamoeba regulata, Strain BSH-02190019" /LENGTH=295 /DNA_ID=CAMNT_0019144677 /DNA_START=86 /DNA_END=969 /DNA_ORIENTATION=+